MAVKASCIITVSKERDVNAVWRFYRIAASTTTPSKPTEAQGKAYVSGGTIPSGWSVSEPSYDGTSTNSLYTCELTSFTDGEVSWSEVSKSSSYEAAKQAYNKASNAESAATDARKYATNYIADVSNGVYVHAEGTPSTPTSGTAKGVRITDQVDIIRNGSPISQFGENVILGKESDNHLMIGNNSYGYYVDDVPISTITCNYDLDEDDDVSSKTMYLKVADPWHGSSDKERSGLILHYDGESGEATYARMFVEHDDYATDVSFIAKASGSQPQLILKNGSAYFIVNARGSIASERVATFNGSMLISGNAGMIQMFGGSSAPRGWVLCNGQALNRTTYSELFSVIGTTYGTGDGSTTFNVPDLRGRAPIGAGTGSSLTNRTLGSTLGVESVTLTAAQSGLRAHTHSFTQPTITWKYSADAASGSAKNRLQNGGTGSSTGDGVSASGGAVGAVSGGAQSATSAHTNMQPSAVVNFIICTGRIV